MPLLPVHPFPLSPSPSPCPAQSLLTTEKMPCSRSGGSAAGLQGCSVAPGWTGRLRARISETPSCAPHVPLSLCLATEGGIH